MGMGTKVVAMLDRQRAQDDRIAGIRRQLLIFAAGLGVILIGLGWVLLMRGFGDNTAVAVVSSFAAREQVSNQLLETTKSLQLTQQQTVDQPQVVQDQLVAQREETKKLSDQIAALTEKLNAVQVSAPRTGHQ
jgi:uncharacterized coiled-coil protein SlyX